MTNNTIKKKKTKLETLNTVLVLLFFFGGGIIFIVPALGITETMFFPFLIVNILIVIFYNIYKKNGRMRKMLVFSRCIAVFILVIVFGAPFVGAGFRDNKAMYFLKREVFVYGVRTEADKVLPKKLPKDITDYYFRTGMQFPAQDYRPYADLIFRCDEKYLSLLIDEAEKNGLIKREPETTFEDFLGDLYYDDSIINNKECLTAYACKYLDVPNYMLYRLDIDVIKQLAETAEVYRNKGSGFAYDKKTGYVIYWS